MSRLLIATTNPAKLAEYRLILRDIGLELELISLADLRISEAPEETGATFTENALIKARFYFASRRDSDAGRRRRPRNRRARRRARRPVASMARCRPTTIPIEALVDEVIRRMQGVEAARRTARTPRRRRADTPGRRRDSASDCAEAAIEGVIAERAYPEIRAGFPYRAVLVISRARNCYLGELGDEEEARISQRRIALLKLRDELERIAAGRRSRDKIALRKT